MPHVVLCILLVLGLPQVAAAAGAIGVPAEILIADGGALERAAVPVEPARGLDLRIGRAQPRVAPDPLDGASAADGDVGTYEPQSDRGLSFGLEIKPRSRIGALAREDDAEDPGLGDQLQRLIERPVFGFRGSYRF